MTVRLYIRIPFSKSLFDKISRLNIICVNADVYLNVHARVHVCVYVSAYV